jgi:hypothetical protein
MSRGRIAVVAILASIGVLLLPSVGRAAAKEQIVFSGEADGSAGEIGFWVWCAVDEAGAYDDCSGAIQFDDLHLTKHVEGEVAETGDDVYEMDVASADGAIACTLTNTPPITHGQSNRIDLDCSSPDATATSWDAVVSGNA